MANRFSAKQTGRPSRLGGSKNRNTLVPWGKTQAAPTVPKAKVSHNSASRSTPSKSLLSTDYPANKPAWWPLDGHRKRRSPTALSTLIAAEHNDIINAAYQRAGYGT